LDTSYFPAIKSALAAGTRLLSHYYTLADHSMVYRFATILYPSYKLEYFKNAEWPDQWVADTEESIKEHYSLVY
ncbi:hypothetical protein BC827DRAFT_1112147, partial [Russula dissimulans]